MQNRPVIAEFVNPRRVTMADTDAGGTVRLGAFIRMMEETEYAFLRDRGLSVVLTDDKGILGFPRLSASVDVLQPARFDDKLSVGLSLIEIDGKHIVYEFVIEGVSGIVASGRFRVVCCRFPPGEPPYAILTPLAVMDALQA